MNQQQITALNAYQTYLNGLGGDAVDRSIAVGKAYAHGVCDVHGKLSPDAEAYLNLDKTIESLKGQNATNAEVLSAILDDGKTISDYENRAELDHVGRIRVKSAATAAGLIDGAGNLTEKAKQQSQIRAVFAKNGVGRNELISVAEDFLKS